MTEQIELHAEIDDAGRVLLKDQYGRTLKGVRHVTLSRDFDDVARVTVEFLEYRDGKAFINKADR